MNRFTQPFSSPEWVNLKLASMQFLRILSVWLESFPQKEASILLILMAAGLCLNMGRIILFNLKVPHLLFSLDTLLMIIAFGVFAYLAIDRVRFLRRNFFKKPNVS